MASRTQTPAPLRGPHPAGLGSLVTVTFSVLLALLTGGGAAPHTGAAPGSASTVTPVIVRQAPLVLDADPGLSLAPAREAPTLEPLWRVPGPRAIHLPTPRAHGRAALRPARRPARRRGRPPAARAPPPPS